MGTEPWRLGGDVREEWWITTATTPNSIDV